MRDLIDREDLILKHATCSYKEPICLACDSSCEYCGVLIKDIENAPKINAIEIRKGVTNGKMMEKVLPIDFDHVFFGTNDKGIHVRQDVVFVHLKGDVGSVYFTKEWWDSPYEGDIEDNHNVKESLKLTDDEGLLIADERADVLNLLNKTFEDNNINLEVAMYEDDGSFFDVMFWKRNSSKPIMEVKK